MHANNFSNVDIFCLRASSLLFNYLDAYKA